MSNKGNKITQWLEKQGYRLPDEGYRQHIDTFRQWFVGYCPDFHDYLLRTSRAQRKLKRYSLGMAKTICEDYASLLLNEKLSIKADAFAELPALLEANRFFERGNRLVEWAMALGTAALVEFKGADGQPMIDYIRGDLIYPLNWDGDNIMECAFGAKRVLGARKDAGEGYYVQVHESRPDGYYVRNAWLDEEGNELPPPEGVQAESGAFPVPMFQIIRPNIVNSIDPESPMGASVYGAAIDQLKAVDMVYDSYVNEFQLGKKRLMVPMSFAQMVLQEDGTYRQMFDPNDLLAHVYQVPEDAKDRITPIDMELRAEEHETGLQRMIDLLSKRCGLGTGRYKFKSNYSVAKTATEVISEDSDLYQSIKRNEKPLERAIIGMVRALAVLSGKDAGLQVAVSFDDSIFEDTGTIIDRSLALVAAGLMSKKDAIMKISRCTEQEAEKQLREIANEQMLDTPSVDAFTDAE